MEEAVDLSSDITNDDDESCTLGDAAAYKTS